MKTALLNNALMQAGAVGAGGFIGALLRYLLSTAVNRHWHIELMPLGTLTVNLLGCLLIGVMAGLADSMNGFSLQLRLFLMVGVLGGFTTFSAFALEGLELLRTGSLAVLLLYAGSHLLAGLSLVWLGYLLVTGR
jgi:fluoride exporter